MGYIDAYAVDFTYTRIDPPPSWVRCPPEPTADEYLAPFEYGEFTWLDGRSGCCPNIHTFVYKSFPFDADGFAVAPYYWPAGTRTNTWNGGGAMPDFLKPLAIFHLVASVYVQGILIAHCRKEHLSYFMRPVPDAVPEVVTPTVDVIQPDPEDASTVGEIILSYDIDDDKTGFTGVSSFSWTDPLGNTGVINILGKIDEPIAWFTFPLTTLEIVSDDLDHPLDVRAIHILYQWNGYRLKLTGPAYRGKMVTPPVYTSGGLDNEMKAEAWEKAKNSILVTIVLYKNYVTYYERDPLAPPDVPPDGVYDAEHPGDIWDTFDLLVNDLPDDQAEFNLSVPPSEPHPGTGTMTFKTV